MPGVFNKSSCVQCNSRECSEIQNTISVKLDATAKGLFYILFLCGFCEYNSVNTQGIMANRDKRHILCQWWLYFSVIRVPKND